MLKVFSSTSPRFSWGSFVQEGEVAVGRGWRYGLATGRPGNGFKMTSELAIGSHARLKTPRRWKREKRREGGRVERRA